MFSLHFSPQNAQARINEFGAGEVPLFLTDVNCSGRENDILDCSATTITQANEGICDFETEPAGVSCFEAPDTTDAGEYMHGHFY